MTLPVNIPASPPPMPPSAIRAPCLVIHANVLVAEDLRDILIAEGADEVIVVKTLAEAPLSPARIAFVSASANAVLASPHTTFWAGQGTPVVLLGGLQRSSVSREAGYHVMNEPFRTEDITALLRRLQIFPSSKTDRCR